MTDKIETVDEQTREILEHVESLSPESGQIQATQELIHKNIHLKYAVEKLEKELDLMTLMARELLDCSEPSKDPLKETRYICASAFISPKLKDTKNE